MSEREKYRPPERRRQARRVKFVQEIVRDCRVIARHNRRQCPSMPCQTPANPVEIRRVDVVDSTNRLARDAIRAGGIDHPVAFVAERQEAGQGRAGRAWHSPAGGLWCTSIWPVPAAEAPRAIDCLGLRVGVACHAAIDDTLRAAGGAKRAQLKWPNDILIDDRKVSGCLCRVERAATTGVTWLLIGVGINANNNPDELGTDLRRAPTSLAREINREINLDELLKSLLAHLARAVAAPGLPADWLAAARAALFGVGTEIEVATPTGTPIRGTLVGLDDRGQLILDTPTGRASVPHAVELIDPPSV
jgi:BirA family transcriptional regulator, biotin operon repressor / biotin---[acetyl-CoA-carboxylase] ligase